MATTLLSLKTQSRERSDMLDSEFVSDSELTSYINASIAELYDILVSRYADYYMAPPHTATLGNGENKIPLPEGFYKLRGLDFYNNGNWITLRKFNFEDRNKYNNALPYSRVGGPGVRYRVFGDEILLTPEDSAQGRYRLYYVPSFTPLEDNGDSFNGINGWEEYVVVDAAIKMLQKQEDDVSVFVMQKQKLLERIEAMAADRDAGEPEVIADLDDIGFGGRGVW